jgi:hypothetical protein
LNDYGTSDVESCNETVQQGSVLLPTDIENGGTILPPHWYLRSYNSTGQRLLPIPATQGAPQIAGNLVAWRNRYGVLQASRIR